MLGVLAMAQPQKGKVYNLKNVGYDKSLSMSELLAAVAVTTNNDDLAQQWLVTSASGETFSLLNLASGMYLKGNNNTSSAWTLSSDEVTLTYTAVSGNYAIRQQGHTNGYGYMHIDASQNAVSWEPNNNNSQWTFNEISYTADELEQVLKSLEEITVSPQMVAKYQQALDALFADKACSELKARTADTPRHRCRQMPTTLPCQRRCSRWCRRFAQASGKRQTVMQPNLHGRPSMPRNTACSSTNHITNPRQLPRLCA